MLPKSHENLREFKSRVDRADQDPVALASVRRMLAEIAQGEDTPAWVIQSMGQVVVECRKIELTEEAEGN